MKNTERNDPAISVNVLEEQARIEKEYVEKGKVRITKKVNEETETITVPVSSEEATIERIPVNKIVEKAPQVRHEGDTIIIPVVKEVIVVEKKLLLIEEVHIKKHTIKKEEKRTIPLRKEEVIIERIPSPADKINS